MGDVLAFIVFVVVLGRSGGLVYDSFGRVLVGFFEECAGSSVMSLAAEEPVLREQAQALVLVLERLTSLPVLAIPWPVCTPAGTGLRFAKCGSCSSGKLMRSRAFES